MMDQWNSLLMFLFWLRNVMNYVTHAMVYLLEEAFY